MAISKMKGTRLGAFRAYFFGFFVCTAGFLFGIHASRELSKLVLKSRR